MSDIEKIINDAWEVKDQINPNSDKQIIDSINKTIDHLNKGEITVAEPNGDDWKINQWIQKGILLSFRINKRKMTKYFGLFLIVIGTKFLYEYFNL